MHLRVFITVICSISLLTSCQSAPTDISERDNAAISGDTLPFDDLAEEPLLPDLQPVETPPAPVVTEKLASAPDDIWLRIRDELSWQTLDNARIDQERNWYLKQKGFMPLIANRAQYYLYHIVEEVEKRGMPMEIALLPFVESNLNPFAQSSSYASGLWQIMPATGKHLGLQQDWWYDGRRDLRDSTRAALDYLEELYGYCDEDWLLTLASYNAGNGRVNRAKRANARKNLPTDFWSISLPRETRRYVPRLIALAQILAEPEKYGVTVPKVANKAPFEVAQLGGQLEIARAAKLAEIDPGIVRALNPGQLRWATSPDRASELLVPVGTAQKLELAVAELDASERVRWQHYRIVRGDSLIRIARKFDTEVSLLREVNNIRGSKIRAGDTMMIPQGGQWASSLALADKPTATRRGYRVKRGDSLYRIAGQFNVSVHEIIAWNALDPKKYLQPGQQLTLYVQGG